MTIIQHAIWLYHRFPLSCPDVQELLHQRGIEVPAKTACVARANPSLRIRDEFCMLFTDQEFVQLYPSRRQPALSCGQLALSTLVQFTENSTDRQMAAQVRARIDLKTC